MEFSLDAPCKNGPARGIVTGRHNGHRASDAHVVDRSLAGEKDILVLKRDPAIRQLLSVANIERLENTDQKGDSHELVLI
jgi:hypothetical protein